MISDLLRACSSLVFAAFSAIFQHADKRLCGKLYVIFGAESAAKRWFSHDYSVFWQKWFPAGAVCFSRVLAVSGTRHRLQ
jgi:hypothetical protein